MLKLTQLVRRSDAAAVQQLTKTVWAVRLGSLVTIKFQRKVADANS
jgi:uncharacterized lipoprotein YmbA